MKSIFLLFFSIVLFSSCSSTREIQEDLKDDFNVPGRVASGRSMMYTYSSDRSDSTAVIVDYQYFTPQFSSGVMDSSYKDSVNATIERLVGWEEVGEAPVRLGPLTDSFFEGFVQRWVKEAEVMAEETESMMYSLDMGFELLDFDKYVELRNHAWSYTGGAHGNGYTNYFCFERLSGNRLFLNDFFSDMAMLQKIAESMFREEMDIPENDSLNDHGFWFENDQFALNENFCFRNDNLVIVFNPYEVAPYAAGTISLEIPFSELEGILK